MPSKTEIIDSLREGDEVRIYWENDGHNSSERGVLWRTPRGTLRLGPEVLCYDCGGPTGYLGRQEIKDVVVIKRAATPEPSLYAVAVFISNGTPLAFKRWSNGWYFPGSEKPIAGWNTLINEYGEPTAVYEQGTVA